MGIDAEILIRKVPRSVVTDEWCKELSWRLCEAIGASHFFVNDGLPPEQYAQADKAWHAAFDAHPLYKQYDAGGNNYEARKALHERILADVGPAPKRRRLAIEPTLLRYREKDDPPPGTVYRQDGDDIVAHPDECLLELSLYGRYYGPGYERGDILAYCAIAEWLEVNIPGCEVWYGGDSSGVCAEPFGDAKRRELRQHLYSAKGRDYFKYDEKSSISQRGIAPPACSLCPGGKYRGSRCGWGPQFSSFHCAGCGKRVESRDNGKTWTEKKDRL